MKIQDPLTQLLATKLTPTQLALIRQLTRSIPPDQMLDTGERTMRAALQRKTESLNSLYRGNMALEKATAAAAASDKHRLALWWKKTNSVSKITTPLYDSLRKIMDLGKSGRFTPEQFKEAVDAFCKGLGEP